MTGSELGFETETENGNRTTAKIPLIYVPPSFEKRKKFESEPRTGQLNSKTERNFRLKQILGVSSRYDFMDVRRVRGCARPPKVTLMGPRIKFGTVRSLERFGAST